jgi:hypothetical protein
MCGRHILLAFVMLAACGSPTLADTLNSFRQAHSLPTQPHPAEWHNITPRAWRCVTRWIMWGFYSGRGPAGARAENVAWGCATESYAVRMWEESSGHRANMLLTDIKRYGIASAAANSAGSNPRCTSVVAVS